MFDSWVLELGEGTLQPVGTAPPLAAGSVARVYFGPVTEAAAPGG